MEYYSAMKKNKFWVSCSEGDEAEASYTEWSKSERVKQVSDINTYIWTLTNDTDEPSEEQMCGHSRGRWWDEPRDENRASSIDIYTPSCVKQWKVAI